MCSEGLNLRSYVIKSNFMIYSFDWYAVYVNEYLLCTRNARMFGFVGPFFLVQPTQFKCSSFLGLRPICKLLVPIDKACSKLSFGMFKVRNGAIRAEKLEIRRRIFNFPDRIFGVYNAVDPQQRIKSSILCDKKQPHDLLFRLVCGICE